MALVLIHTQQGEDEKREFSRVPTVGEYVSFDAGKLLTYRVGLVNHFASKSDFDAEIFVSPVDYDETTGVMRRRT